MDAQRIPESFSAFCRIVSLTAANTRRMLEVSVACVRLRNVSAVADKPRFALYSLRVEIEMRPVHLVESPEQVFRGAVNVVAAGVIREVVPKR